MPALMDGEVKEAVTIGTEEEPAGKDEPAEI